jgi:chaperonin cofactor prefoldin
LQKYPQFADVVFLGKVGNTLRQVVGDTATADLPEDIRLLLRRLERIERRQNIPKTLSRTDGSV